MDTKPCTTCGRELPLMAYTKRKAARDGRTSRCKECRNHARRDRYADDAEHREKINRRNRAWHARNIDAVRDYKRRYYQANKRRVDARAKRWRRDNPERAREHARQAYHRHKDRPDRVAYREAYLARPEVQERRRERERQKENRERKRRYMAEYLSRPEVKARRKQNDEKWRRENRRRYNARQARRRARERSADGSFTGADVARIWHRQRGLCIYCREPLGASPDDTGTYHVDHVMPLAKGGTNAPDNIQCLCPTCNLSKRDKHPLEFARQMGMLF